MDLVHFWLAGGGADEKHGFLLVRYLPDNQLLKRDHRRLVVLGSEEKNEGKEEEEEERAKISDRRISHSHCEAVQVFPQDTHCSESEITYHCSKHISLIFLLQQEQDV